MESSSTNKSKGFSVFANLFIFLTVDDKALIPKYFHSQTYSQKELTASTNKRPWQKGEIKKNLKEQK
jgi:hypothetical protein